jgi:hypothetical protein
MVGWLRARLPDARLDRVTDPRRVHRQKWPLDAMLSTVVVGLVGGCRSLADVEALTQEMSPAARRALGIRGRMADTTMRDALVQVQADDLRGSRARTVRSAHRRRALEPEELPWGVASMDGKASTIGSWDHQIAQQQGSRGVVRTITSTLVSSGPRICLDAHPIPADTNEMGAFPAALSALLDKYAGIDLFSTFAGHGVQRPSRRMLRGECALHKGSRLHYIMVLNESQPTLHAEASSVRRRPHG